MSTEQAATNSSNGGTGSLMSTFNKLKPLIRTPQLYWFLGHFFAILFFLNYTFLSFISKNTLWLYNWSLNSIILTYLIVLRQSYNNRSILNIFSNFYKFLRDDNVQYLLLALILRLSSKFPGPIASSLYPFIIFALFHSLTYTNTYIIPNLTILSDDLKRQYINTINNFVVQYNERSLYASSSFEVYLLIPVLMSLVKLVLFFEWARSNPFRTLKKLVVNLSIIVFIKLRYNQSKHMQAIVQSYDMRANQILYSSPYLPPQLQQAYQTVKNLVITYIGPIKIPQQQNIRKE